MTWAILSYVGLGLIVAGLNAGDRQRYRDGNFREPVLNCRIHKRGGMWFFRIGRVGGSIYLRRAR